MKTARRNVFVLALLALFSPAPMTQAAPPQAGTLFVTDGYSNNIDEFTSGGTGSVYAGGLSYPLGLAFDAHGDLFESDHSSGNVYESSRTATEPPSPPV